MTARPNNATPRSPPSGSPSAPSGRRIGWNKFAFFRAARPLNNGSLELNQRPKIRKGQHVRAIRALPGCQHRARFADEMPFNREPRSTGHSLRSPQPAQPHRAADQISRKRIESFPRDIASQATRQQTTVKRFTSGTSPATAMTVRSHSHAANEGHSFDALPRFSTMNTPRIRSVALMTLFSLVGLSAAPAVAHAQYAPLAPQVVFSPANTAIPPASLPVFAPATVPPSATVTPLYTPVTLFNWWRPRTVAGYMVTPQTPTTVARPVYSAAIPAPETAYYQPSYHPGGIVVPTPHATHFAPPQAIPSAVPPVVAVAPVITNPPVYATPQVIAAAPVPVVYARPVVGPRQAYLYSRGPLGFPRLDPVPVGTVVQPAATPLIPVVVP